MAKLLKLRRGTTTQHGSFTGAEGEVTVDTDKESLVVHDGSTAGGFPIARENLSNVSSATITGRLGTGSIVKAKLEADAIDGTKLADNACNSEHYTDGSIDTAHYAAGSVNATALADNAVTTTRINDGAVINAKIAAGSVDENKLAISNAGSVGQYLQKTNNAGGLTWTTVDLTSIPGTTFTGDVTFDNGTNAGKDIIWDESADLLQFKDNVHATFGDGSDLRIYHDGSHNIFLGVNGADFKIKDASNTSAIFDTSAGVELYYGNSKRFETSSAGISVTGTISASSNINIGDSDEFIAGTGNDLRIWHNATDSYIKNYTGDLWIQADGDDLYMRAADDVTIYTQTSDQAINCIGDGGVELYHNNNKKAETVSGGFTITGTCTATAYAGDGSALTGVQPFPSGTKMLFQQTAAPTGWTKVTSSVDNKALRLVSGTVGSGGNATFTGAFASYTPGGNIAATANATASFSANATTGNSGANTSSVSTSGNVNNHTLSNNQMPSHSHSTNLGSYNFSYGDSNRIMKGPTSGSFNQGTNNTGGGGSHSHGFSGSSHSHSVNNHTHSVSVSGTTGNHTHTSGAFSGTARDFAVQYIDVIIASKD